MVESVKLCISQLVKLWPSKYWKLINATQNKSNRLKEKYCYNKNLCMRTSLKSMKLLEGKKRYTSLWNIAPMENSFKKLLKMDQWQKNKLLKYSIKYYQPYSIWRKWVFLIGILNQKTSSLIRSGMQNLSTLASAADNTMRRKEWEGQLVELHLIHLPKFY